ncbi:MAG: hypothetical protein EOP21_00575 [Hyphomicrobiales bacterium]|nr:MAG: hypothetical protein EOP21_00575 [Hyphomicrobiales bacterium]
MPMDEPDLGSRELNERRLYERWKRYLDDELATLALLRHKLFFPSDAICAP